VDLGFRIENEINMNNKFRKFSDEEKNAFINEHYDRRNPHKSIARQLPSIATQAKSLLKAGANWAKHGFELVDKNQLEKRLSICAGCDLWDQSGFGGTGRCSECGCSTQAKLRMASEKCPLGKW
jgi:hypothetical protein